MYALVRILKPRVVVETGVDKGLGSCVICAALRRNKMEGADGQYFGTDINPKAGFLLDGDYSLFGEILYGDSIETLERFESQIDVFVNDSDHSAEYERREYEVVWLTKCRLTELLLVTMSDITTKLWEFCRKEGWSFSYIAEEPRDFWFEGGGVGVAQRKSS